MQLKPLNDNVLIKPDPHEYQDSNPKVQEALNSGKIILPEAYEGRLKKAAPTGRILAKGPDCKQKMTVGDRVYFGQYAGAIIMLGEEKVKIVKECDVLAVINGRNDKNSRSVSEEHGCPRCR